MLRKQACPGYSQDILGQRRRTYTQTWPQQCPVLAPTPMGARATELLFNFSKNRDVGKHSNSDYLQSIGNSFCPPPPRQGWRQTLSILCAQSPERVIQHSKQPVLSFLDSTRNRLQADRQTDSKNGFPASAWTLATCDLGVTSSAPGASVLHG